MAPVLDLVDRRRVVYSPVEDESGFISSAGTTSLVSNPSDGDPFGGTTTSAALLTLILGVMVVCCRQGGKRLKIRRYQSRDQQRTNRTFRVLERGEYEASRM